MIDVDLILNEEITEELVIVPTIINGITGQVSVSNAYMAYVEDNEGNHIGVELYASNNITSNTEILVDYGNEYVYP